MRLGMGVYEHQPTGDTQPDLFSANIMHGPAYGAQKAGVDTLAADMAVDFAGTGVSTVSIWMGVLLTEKFLRAFDGHPDALAKTAKRAETPEFTGRLIDALYRDPALSQLSGQALIGAELAMRLRHLGRQRSSATVAPGDARCPRTPSTVVVR